jgi:hypothetical protein
LISLRAMLSLPNPWRGARGWHRHFRNLRRPRTITPKHFLMYRADCVRSAIDTGLTRLLRFANPPVGGRSYEPILRG